MGHNKIPCYAAQKLFVMSEKCYIATADRACGRSTLAELGPLLDFLAEGTTSRVHRLTIGLKAARQDLWSEILSEVGRKPARLGDQPRVCRGDGA
jgi:hypothetical protein